MRRRSRATMAAVGVVALVATACSADPGITLVASSPGTIGIGEQRVILAWADPKTSTLEGGPDTPVEAEFLVDGDPITTAPTHWVWTIENTRGFYVANVDFASAGVYQVRLVANGKPVTTASPFEVTQTVQIPEVGTPAPASVTKTLADHDLSQLTTDPDPDPTFYQETVAQAVESGDPSVIVFATPAFCTSAACGPTLDVVKSISGAHPKAHFVHVEIYDNIDSAGQGKLEQVQAVTDWGLPSEPWVFVVDATGTIRARFEGSVSPAELETALAAVGA